MIDLARAHAFLDVGQGVELDQLPALAAQVDPPHVARRLAILGIDLHNYEVRLVVGREGADPATAEERLERRRDVAYRNAKIFGTIAIERDPQLRLVHEEIGLHVREAFDLRGATHERSHDFRELREIRILHHVLDRLRKADRSWSVGERHDAGDANELGEQPADHLLDGRMALAKVLEDDADERAVHPSGEPAHDREVPVDVGGPTDDLLDLSHVAIGVWERRTLRTTHHHEEKPTIVVGDQLVLQASRRENKKYDNRQGHHRQRPAQYQGAMVDRTPEQPGVALPQRVEAPLEHLEQLAKRVRHAEDLGSEHRGQRKCREAWSG